MGHPRTGRGPRIPQWAPPLPGCTARGGGRRGRARSAARGRHPVRPPRRERPSRSGPGCSARPNSLAVVAAAPWASRPGGRADRRGRPRASRRAEGPRCAGGGRRVSTPPAPGPRGRAAPGPARRARTPGQALHRGSGGERRDPRRRARDAGHAAPAPASRTGQGHAVSVRHAGPKVVEKLLAVDDLLARHRATDGKDRWRDASACTSPFGVTCGAPCAERGFRPTRRRRRSAAPRSGARRPRWIPAGGPAVAERACRPPSVRPFGPADGRRILRWG